MNGFLLDTNVASELVRQRPNESVTAWIAAQRLETLFLSVITIGELRKGITILPQGTGEPNSKSGWTSTCYRSSRAVFFP
jgi:predicted nucleic acid-binding protein